MLGYLIAGAFLIASLIGFVAYERKAGADGVRLEWKKAEDTQRKREAEASTKAASDLEAERKKRRTVIQERTVYVDRNIEKLVDSGVCIKPVGVLCINGSIVGKGAAGCKPDSGVSGPKPAG